MWGRLVVAAVVVVVVVENCDASAHFAVSFKLSLATAYNLLHLT